MSEAFQVRQYRPDDLQDLVVLCNSVFAAGPGSAAVRHEHLIHDIQMSDLREAGVVVAECQGRVTGYTQLIRQSDPVNFLLPVQLRGTPPELTVALFDRLQEIGARAGWEYLQTGFSERDQAAMKLCALLDLEFVHSLESLMSIVQPGLPVLRRNVLHPRLSVQLPRLARLINTIFAEDWGFHEQTPEILQEYLNVAGVGEEEVFVLIHQGKWCGVLLLRRDPQLARQGTGSIELLGVVEAMRNQGLGKQLLRHAHAYFAAHHLKRMETNVDSENQIALRFYLSQGFAPVGLIHYYRCQLH